MPAKYLKIHIPNPEINKIRQVVEVLRAGGLVIFPTDTIYGMGCDLFNPRAVERLCQVKGIKPNKMNLSFICRDISEVSQYVKHLSTPYFKLLKKTLPGPFTFIFLSSSKVPKVLKHKKKTVGIRVPDNIIALELVNHLGHPIVTTSLKQHDRILEYATDPEEIREEYGHRVDLIIDGGSGHNVPSSVIDCTDEQPKVVREGLGNIQAYL